MRNKKGQRGKVLCLGVSYPSAAGLMKSRGSDSSIDDTTTTTARTMGDDHDRPSVDTVLDCVRHGVLTQMDGRDLVRCISTEDSCEVDVYTVSQERGAMYRHDRHLDANFCDRRFVQALFERFPRCQFDQIVLDYFWSPVGWDACHWKRPFFDRTLVEIAKMGVLRHPAGVIYLPFCLHCFKEIAVSSHVLLQYYDISFVKKRELHRNALWKGTQQVDDHIMQSVLGKHRQQEETYCSFGPKDIAEAIEDPRISKTELLKLARSLENFGDIRFLALRLVRHSARKATSSDQRYPVGGRFLGCIHPSKVKKGIDQMYKSMEAGLTPRRKTKDAGDNVNIVTPIFGKEYTLLSHADNSWFNSEIPVHAPNKWWRNAGAPPHNGHNDTTP